MGGICTGCAGIKKCASTAGRRLGNDEREKQNPDHGHDTGKAGQTDSGLRPSPHAGKCVSAAVYFCGYAGGGAGARRERAGGTGSVGMADLSDVRLRAGTDSGLFCNHFPEIRSRSGRRASQGGVSGRPPLRCRCRFAYRARTGSASGCAYVDGNPGGNPWNDPFVPAFYLCGHSCSAAL